MTGNTTPFGQPFSQTGGQQMGAAGVNPQLPNKPGMANSLSPFPADIKSTPVTSVPNMVSWTCCFQHSLPLPSAFKILGWSSFYNIIKLILHGRLSISFPVVPHFRCAVCIWNLCTFLCSDYTFSRITTIKTALYPFILAGTFSYKPDKNAFTFCMSIRMCWVHHHLPEAK